VGEPAADPLPAHDAAQLLHDHGWPTRAPHNDQAARLGFLLADAASTGESFG
jgi:hypothetical protein